MPSTRMEENLLEVRRILLKTLEDISSILGADPDDPAVDGFVDQYLGDLDELIDVLMKQETEPMFPVRVIRVAAEALDRIL